MARAPRCRMTSGREGSHRHAALHELHDIEHGSDHGLVLAQHIGLRHRYVGVLERADHPVLPVHGMSGFQQLAGGFATQHVVLPPALSLKVGFDCPPANFLALSSPLNPGICIGSGTPASRVQCQYAWVAHAMRGDSSIFRGDAQSVFCAPARDNDVEQQKNVPKLTVRDFMGCPALSTGSTSGSMLLTLSTDSVV